MTRGKTVSVALSAADCSGFRSPAAATGAGHSEAVIVSRQVQPQSTSRCHHRNAGVDSLTTIACVVRTGRTDPIFLAIPRHAKRWQTGAATPGAPSMNNIAQILSAETRRIQHVLALLGNGSIGIPKQQVAGNFRVKTGPTDADCRDGSHRRTFAPAVRISYRSVPVRIALADRPKPGAIRQNDSSCFCHRQPDWHCRYSRH